MASRWDPIKRVDAEALTASSNTWPIEKESSPPTDAAFAVHDAKNMLGVIAANVEYLATALSGDNGLSDVHSTLEDLRTATGRATQLLHEALLTLRGAELRRTPATRVRAGPVVMRAVERIQRRADAAGVTVDLSAMRDQPAAIEPDLLERVLDNLLDNALRFSKPGDVIEVACTTRGGRLIVSVADQGPGIPGARRGAVLGSLAEPSSAEGHFGLGLAFCRSVARAHGGDVTVGNRASGGACVVLEIG
jgi:signal transduction histidine kinase